jgi:hypothetical protein
MLGHLIFIRWGDPCGVICVRGPSPGPVELRSILQAEARTYKVRACWKYENNQTNLDFDKPHRIKVLHGNLEGFYSTATVTLTLTVFGGKHIRSLQA